MGAYGEMPIRQSELEGEEKVKSQTAKRFSVVSVRLVKESSILYKERSVRSPEDGYKLLKLFLGDANRE
jgi:DNA repair protein RadC